MVLIQTAASNLLVAVGQRYVNEVFDQLKNHFHPGQLPQIYILNTMANLAEVNAFGVVPNLTSVLASMLPMLGMAKTDSYKCAFASGTLFLNQSLFLNLPLAKLTIAISIKIIQDLFINVINASFFTEKNEN